MNMYWQYWKRGWWSWLMQLCQNLVCLVLFLTLAMVFGGESLAYVASASLVGLFVVLPVAGWLFEAFAANSNRIAQNRHGASKGSQAAIGAEPGAAPNCGPAKLSGNSGVSEGPPPVS